jgi:anti-sigma B factor antagonist
LPGVVDKTRLNEHPVGEIERREGGAIVIHLVGELDLYNAPAVRQALLELTAEQPERLVIDLGEVDFVDSTALGVLIEARTKLANRRSFLLAAPGLETHRALQISGLDQHLAVHETVEAALRVQVDQPESSRSRDGSSPSESRSSS